MRLVIYDGSVQGRVQNPLEWLPLDFPNLLIWLCLNDPKLDASGLFGGGSFQAWTFRHPPSDFVGPMGPRIFSPTPLTKFLVLFGPYNDLQVWIKDLVWIHMILLEQNNKNNFNNIYTNNKSLIFHLFIVFQVLLSVPWPIPKIATMEPFFFRREATLGLFIWLSSRL